MKKVICILSSVLMIFLFSAPAFADMDGPAFVNYEAYVSNPDGAKTCNVYDYDDFVQKTVPYQTKVTVTYEYKKDGVIYASARYGDDYAYLNTSDLAKNTPKVGKDQAEKLSPEFVRCIINKKGAALRDGPAESYDEVVRIPYGEIVKSSYGVGVESSSDATWIFVTYKDYSGWLHCYERLHEDGEEYDCATVLPKTRTAKVLQSGYYLYENPNSESEKISSQIAENTKLSFRYTFSTHFETFAFAEYNGVKGWLPLHNFYKNKTFSCEYPVDFGVYVNGKNGTPMYEKVPESGIGGGSVLKTIPYGKILNATKNVVYYTEPTDDGYEPIEHEWMYVSYDGQNGWVYTCWGEKTGCVNFSYVTKGKVKSSFSLSKEPNASSGSAGTAAAGEQITATYYYDGIQDEYYLVKAEDGIGWAAASVFNNHVDKIDTEYSVGFGSFSEAGFAPAAQETAAVLNEDDDAEEPAPAEFTEPAVTDYVGDVESKDSREPAHFGIKTLIIACVVAAGVLALTAVVVLIFLNKKKTQNNFPRY